MGSTVIRAGMLPALLLIGACSSVLPWQKAPDASEVNLSFVLRNNLLTLPSASLNGVPGRYFFGSATPRTVLAPRMASALGSGTVVFGWGSRESVALNPLTLDLGRTGDALIGADAIGRNAVTIDYRSGLLTLQEDGITRDYMSLYRFEGAPAVTITVDGTEVRAIVDTASPDTLVLPAARAGRGRAMLELAGSDLGAVDVRYAPVAEARLGNRLLSRFLISIDYGGRIVGLWRDPRIP